MAKVSTILWGWKFLRRQVTTPASTRPITPSLIISEWMPRSFFSPRKVSTASGIAPMPSCRQSPSWIRLATWLPMAFSTSPMAGGWISSMGRSLGTK